MSDTFFFFTCNQYEDNKMDTLKGLDSGCKRLLQVLASGYVYMFITLF